VLFFLLNLLKKITVNGMVKEVKGAVTTNDCQWDSERSFYPRRNFGS